MMRLDGNKSTLYMRFDKILPSAQGMGIWEDRAYILYDTGVCAVYDLQSRKPTALARFPLGSYNSGTPTGDYLNHANSCMFGTLHFENNPIPLLYVNTGTGIGYDAEGYYCRCAVENIELVRDAQGAEGYSARTLQTISFLPGTGAEGSQFESPCWGCPSWLVDSQRKLLYIVSARYRTTRGHVPEGEKNRYLITTFPLPALSDGEKIILTHSDIIDQFAVASDLQFTQGGTLMDDKIYYTFGCPRLGYPLQLAVFDLKKKSLQAIVENMDAAFENEEIECCAPYRGRLLCNTCDGSIFTLPDECLPL